MSNLNKIDEKLLDLTISVYDTYFDKEKTQSFLMQLFSIFYTLKNSVSLLFNKFSSQSLNPSRNVLKCFIVFTPYIYLIDFCISFSISFFPACSIYLLPGSWEFCCLVAVTFKFTVLYKSVNSNKQDKSNTTTKFCILKYQISL